VISSTALVGTSFATPIEVTTIQRTGETSSLSPNKATILLDYSENGEIESVTFEMRDVIVGAGRIGENQRAQLVVPSLQVKGVVFPTNDEDQSIANLLHQAEESTSPNVKSTAANLRRHVAALDNHVAGRIGQRWAVSILPLLAILLGSLLALRNSERMPLNVYAKVFIPTVVAMLLIFSGGQMIRDAKEITGFSVMWIGNFALACLVIFHWLRLRVT
jgi:lipopolysaccharide export LptBFGC system permease protein LptF